MKYLLGENKLAYLTINYVDTKRISQEIFDKIVSIDITQTKRFTEWIINQYINDPSIEKDFSALGQAIQAYVKYNNVTKDIDFKNKSIEEFISEIKSTVSEFRKPEQQKELTDILSKYKVGTILAHTIYVLKKGTPDADFIFSAIPAVSPDITSLGDVIYVGNNNSKRYIISFAADTYVDESGNSIPINTQNVELWDNIFSWLYQKNYVQEDIIASIDLFGDYYQNSKLAKTIESHNPQQIFDKYYSNENNKLLNIVINTNQKSISDYGKYIDKFKNLGFGLKGILMNVDLGSPDVAELKSQVNDEEYENEVKAHFKRTSQSFDATTFNKIKQGFNSNATLYFMIMRDTDPTNGIFLESGNNIIGFVDRKELAHFLSKFHSVRKIEAIVTQINPDDEQKKNEYQRELENLKGDIKKIIEYSKSLKHYIIGV